jgi:DNA-binding response OmpR family regulator
LKILVVDDEPRLAKSLARLLESDGHETTVAYDGLEAWTLFEREPERWDMLITDIRMPRLDGVALARRVREHGSGIRVVFISGHGELPNIGELSPAAFLAKPFNHATLVATMTSSF